MKRISLAPYTGDVYYAKTYAEMRKLHLRMTGREPDCAEVGVNGAMIALEKRGYAPNYLVFGSRPSTVAHEMSHVALEVFSNIGTDPRTGGGEPFCYLLGHLMDEAMRK